MHVKKPPKLRRPWFSTGWAHLTGRTTKAAVVASKATRATAHRAAIRAMLEDARARGGERGGNEGTNAVRSRNLESVAFGSKMLIGRRMSKGTVSITQWRKYVRSHKVWTI